MTPHKANEFLKGLEPDIVPLTFKNDPPLEDMEGHHRAIIVATLSNGHYFTLGVIFDQYALTDEATVRHTLNRQVTKAREWIKMYEGAQRREQKLAG